MTNPRGKKLLEQLSRPRFLPGFKIFRFFLRAKQVFFPLDAILIWDIIQKRPTVMFLNSRGFVDHFICPLYISSTMMSEIF